MRRVLLALLVVQAVVFTVRPAAAGPADDAYVEGYAAAILEREFNVTVHSLRVRNGVITLASADVLGIDRAKIITVLSRIRGAQRVEVVGEALPEPLTAVASAPTAPAESRDGKPSERETGPLPGGQLFNPLIADPRWPHFAAAYQRYLNDKTFKDVAAVSFGESFALYRDTLGSGWWDFGLQAGVFAVFDFDADSKDLINADYFAAAFTAYRYADFSALLRLFHQSSHLGDEFLLRSRVSRVNLSYESVDLKLSYELWDMFRLYGGAGRLFDQDPSRIKPWSTQVGAEFKSPWRLFPKIRPIAAVDVQQREENGYSADLSARAGIEWEGVLAPRSFQFLLEYFRGHSPNGQFFKQKIDYLGLGAHFHF